MDRRVKSYVLRQGHFTSAQKRSYDQLAKEFIIPYSDQPKNLSTFFANENPVTLEIGFGMGQATAQIALANRDKNYLGIEVHRPGVGKLLWEIEKNALTNIKIIEHDAVAVVEKMLPADSLAAIHIFFPDPWPKKRHNKRRLIKRPFTDLLTRALRPGGYLYMVTDWEAYGEWALTELNATPELFNAYSGFAPPQSWRPRTKFEQKGILKNHVVRELFFSKKPAEYMNEVKLNEID